ncbi:carboxylate-amine ligase [Rhodospirillum rubrum]|uniref:carboxylate-amine ligase n=1 Tax=Rhodospirillum rubrum TaxID=1085 RepID=UPI0019073FD7|nr:carboxylate-amine ligase [Rhodospirillum rubrum]MBK1665067.1 carboxylate-amine ligase [Rhodospirillum rubrum]MBK1677017.1 carboxylate-amine ligase [Rhodospirillum rubrum]
MREPAFTVGIEEEYLLVDRQSRALAADPPEALMTRLAAAFGDTNHGAVTPEFLRAQIEVGTKVCDSVAEAGEALGTLRRVLAEEAQGFGLAPIAASTHPFAEWGDLKHTPKERYDLLAEDLQAVVRRLVICGMHVHVGIEDPDLRMDLMTQVSYFLPHLLALTTSSPFWRGEDSGLKSYRIAVFSALPRTGLPDSFSSFAEYERHVEVLVGAGLIEDSTRIWWDIRPSHRFPTLEMRIADVCTRLDDALCVAALFRCLLRMLYRLRRSNQRWRQYARLLIAENRWRAQRYGLDGGLVDFGRGEVVPFADLIEELLELVAPDAAVFGCQAEVLHARTILRRGTSAHNQLRVFAEAMAGGMTRDEALVAVVDHLIAQTVVPLGVAAGASEL